MQHGLGSPWRAISSDHAKPQYNLNHAMSMVNLHDEPSWYSRGPSSPTASSASSCTSRSATPTSATTNNPWLNNMAGSGRAAQAMAAQPSPEESPSRTPQLHSRATTPTPLAPQPIRPINPAGFVPYASSFATLGESFRGSDYPSSPFPGSPNPYRQTVASFSPLVNGFINTSTASAQGQSLSGWLYDLARRHFEPAMVRKIWQWTLSNPRLAILLVVCEDAASWRQAAFFDLRDETLPLSEERLQGIVTNPRRVVDEQWRATSKELPLTGVHTDFSAREIVPLQHINVVTKSKASNRIVDIVRVLSDPNERVFIRKRFVVTRPSQRAALLEQINKYRAFDHKSIARLLCSYAHASHVGILTAEAQCTLDEYLARPNADAARPKRLVDWMYELSQALDYLHAQSVCHRSIRPRKILVEGSRIFFAAFGVGGGHSDTLGPTASSLHRLDQFTDYHQDQAYVFAAPETLISRGKRFSDVFSLGCVFLSMLTVAQGLSLTAFAQHRAGSSHDTSFHKHLDRVASWRHRLLAVTTTAQRNGAVGSNRRLRQLKSESDWLHIVQDMVSAKPKERIKISVVVNGHSTSKSGGRRSSFDACSVNTKATVPSERALEHDQSGLAKRSDAVQKPELSVFDGYFRNQQSRKSEPTSVW